MMIYKKINIYKLVISIAIFAYMVFYLKTIDGWHFIDNINLIFHEAGHFFFGFLGMTIRILGGTLMQILTPVLFIFYFYNKKDNFSGSVLLFWLSQNIFNVSVYLGDALKMELPLLGGDSSIHDWNYLLSKFNLLIYTEKISEIVYFIGFIVLIFAISYSIRFSINDKNYV